MSLIIHPEVEKLKDRLSQLIFEYDYLINQICPKIERQYVLEFGLFEYELYKLELKIDKLKRKIQLIQIEINHENEVDLNKIDEILAREFEEYEKQLQAQVDEIKSLEDIKTKQLSDEEFKKLKKLYKLLIKKLHPDLNPNQTFLEYNLFLSTVKHFENGDLKGLESISAILPEKETEEISEIDDLKNLIGEYEKRICDVKKDYPYNKKGLLDDKDSGNEYKQMIIELIDDRKQKIKKLENKIDELI
jgi:hypothetical protein